MTQKNISGNDWLKRENYTTLPNTERWSFYFRVSHTCLSICLSAISLDTKMPCYKEKQESFQRVSCPISTRVAVIWGNTSSFPVIHRNWIREIGEFRNGLMNSVNAFRTHWYVYKYVLSTHIAIHKLACVLVSLFYSFGACILVFVFPTTFFPVAFLSRHGNVTSKPFVFSTPRGTYGHMQAVYPAKILRLTINENSETSVHHPLIFQAVHLC